MDDMRVDFGLALVHEWDASLERSVLVVML